MDVMEKTSNEKRLIDASAMRDGWLENGENEYVYDANAVLNSIDSQPTVGAVEVVRCKDCIHRDPEDKKCDCSFQARGGIFPMDDNDFCSYGEKVKI